MTTAHFHPPRLDSKPQRTLLVNSGELTNVGNFRATYDMLRPTAAKSNGLDIGAREVQTSEIDAASLPDLGGKSTHSRVSGSSLVRPARTGLFQTGELQTLTQAVVDRSSWAVSAEGQVWTVPYGGVLRPHRTVNVSGAGDLFSGTYYVVKVLHTLDQTNYTQTFELRRNALTLTGSEAFSDTGGTA